MKLLFTVAMFAMAVTAPAFAVCPGNPNTFTNGTSANANEVNQNFNNLLNCANTLAPLASPIFSGPMITIGSDELFRLQGPPGMGIIYAGVDANQPWIGTRTENDLRFVNTHGDVMRLTKDSNVGIGTPNPTTRLTVAGNVTVNGSVATCVLGTGTGATNCTSDIRLKERVTPIDGALEKILSLRGVTFHWRDADRSGPEHLGVIAQDVEGAFPQAVSTMQAGDLNDAKAVDYAVLVAPLIEAVRTLKAENDALRTRLERIEAKIDDDISARSAPSRTSAELRGPTK